MKGIEDPKFQKVVPNTAKVIYSRDKKILGFSKKNQREKDWIIRKFEIIYIINLKLREVILSKGPKSRRANQMSTAPMILPYDQVAIF